MFQILYTWILVHGIKIICIIFIAFLVVKISQKVIKKTIREAIKTEKGAKDNIAEKKREDTLIRIFNSILSIVVWAAAFLIILPEFGINIGPILAGAGVLGVALGFGAQYVVRDFLAGLFIILENQYRVGDVVCLDDVCGGVEDITLRKTVLRDLDGALHHIPNGSFKKASNLTKGYSRAHMNISVSYKEDIDKVINLINEVGKNMANDSLWKDDILKPIQVLGSGPNDFGINGMEIKVLGETKPSKQWDILKEFRKRLKVAFDKKGIEIPFPQISIWTKKK